MSIYTKEIFPSGYSVIRKDRDIRDGGVLLAVKDTINITQLSSPSNLEMISVEIDPDLILCLIYQPPNSSDQNNSTLLSYLTSLDKTKNTLFIGDLNLPDADWEVYGGNSLIADEFAEMAYNYNLTPYVTGPTHRDGNTLDIVLSNLDNIYHTETNSTLYQLTFHQTIT